MHLQLLLILFVDCFDLHVKLQKWFVYIPIYVRAKRNLCIMHFINYWTLSWAFILDPIQLHLPILWSTWNKTFTILTYIPNHNLGCSCSKLMMNMNQWWVLLSRYLSVYYVFKTSSVARSLECSHQFMIPNINSHLVTWIENVSIT